MSENEYIINHLNIQINDLNSLLNKSKGKYDQRKIDSLEAEIKGLEMRKNKIMMEVN